MRTHETIEQHNSQPETYMSHEQEINLLLLRAEIVGEGVTKPNLVTNEYYGMYINNFSN